MALERDSVFQRQGLLHTRAHVHAHCSLTETDPRQLPHTERGDSANSVYATRIHECGPSRLWGSDLENVLLTKPCISADSEFCFTNIHIQVKKT